MSLIKWLKTSTQKYMDVSDANPLPVSMEGSTINATVNPDITDRDTRQLGIIKRIEQTVPVSASGKVTMETLANAVTVAVGGSQHVSFNGQGASEVYVLINCSQAWTATVNTPVLTAVSDCDFLYPKAGSSNQTAKSDVTYPSYRLYCLPFSESPASLAEARSMAASWDSGSGMFGMGVRVYNQGAADATVTIRVMRVWL